MKKLRQIVLLITVIVTACAAPQTETDPVAVTTEIRALWDGFIQSWESNDAAGCASYYAPHGRNIPPEMDILNGREAIRDFYEFLFTMNASSTYTHTTQSLAVCGDYAIEEGAFQVIWVRHDGSTWTYNARALTHWKKNIDGVWEIETLMFNTPPEV